MDTSFNFNPDMFRLARNYRGLTQSDLSAQTEISQSLLSKFDHGVKTPTREQLDRISVALEFPVPFFIQTGDDLPSGLIFHRKRVSLKEKERSRIESEVKLRLKCLKTLLLQLDIDSNIPYMDLNEHSNDPREVARALRYYWKIADGPIKNVIALLENNGIIVLRFDFGNDTLDGFFIFDERPCIAINSRFPMDRQRFTLCHELGHIIMHKIPDDNIEKEADTFASEFLMPERDINKDFIHRRIDLKLLISLKPIWKVSIAALIKRAQTLDHITPSNVRRLYSQMSALQIRKTEPVTLPLEVPSLIGEIIETYYKELNYSREEIQEILCISSKDFLRFFPPFPIHFPRVTF